MPEPSSSHVVLIPSYNSGPRLVNTARAALNAFAPVWVIIDGSTDNSEELVQNLAAEHEGLRILRVNPKRGRGGAVLFGAQAAEKMGFTHVLTVDAEGTHPATAIAPLVEESENHLAAAILAFEQGSRGIGKAVTTALANIESLGAGVRDASYGLGVYPIGHLRAVMEWHPFGRRSDFEPELAVRLSWRRVPLRNLAIEAYAGRGRERPSEGGYRLEPMLLVLMHLRLLFGGLWRLPYLVLLRAGILAKRR